jgi:adenine-specific DNA-methyltransferase
MHFPIIAPDGSKVHPIAPDGSEGRWRVGKKTMDELIDDDLVEFKKDDNGKWLAYEKIYYEEGEVKVIKERSILYHLANTGDGTKVLTELFSEKDKFPNPKPVELIKWIFTYSTQKDSIVLDSFAGSGTTMHAIMDLNKEDSGNRQCILVQMTEATDAEPKKNICKDITRERIKRAIDKYGYNSALIIIVLEYQLTRKASCLENFPLLSSSLNMFIIFVQANI